MFLLLAWRILLCGAIFDNYSPFDYYGQGIFSIEIGSMRSLASGH
jgi:hypothetical protein